MLKLLTVTLVLVSYESCGTDTSGTGPAPSASPSKASPSTAPQAQAASQGSVSGSGTAASTPTVAVTTTPKPSSAPIAFEQIVQQPFETNDWAYDFRGVTLSYGTDQYSTQVLTYKKTPSGTLNCWVRVVIQIPSSGSWATLTFDQIAGSQVAGCWDAGQTIRSVWFKIGSCQGYSQQTYICGKPGIPYDLISLY